MQTPIPTHTRVEKPPSRPDSPQDPMRDVEASGAEATAGTRVVTQGSSGETAGWEARLHLEVDRTPERSRLREVRHFGPLRVQRVFHPEPSGTCHIYVLHPPGGIAAGDRLDVRVRVEREAHALLTSPAAQKLYRCPTRESHQHTQLEVQAGTLEWLPQETIAFDGARSRSEIEVTLDVEARFIGWEVLCLGRAASGEAFTRGDLDQRFRIRRAGRPIWSDRIKVTPEGPVMQAPWGLCGCPIVGTLVCVPAHPGWAKAARAAFTPTADELFEVSVLNDVLVCRFLGHKAHRARRALSSVWGVLRPLAVGCAAHPPRIWAT